MEIATLLEKSSRIYLDPKNLPFKGVSVDSDFMQREAHYVVTSDGKGYIARILIGNNRKSTRQDKGAYWYSRLSAITKKIIEECDSAWDIITKIDVIKNTLVKNYRNVLAHTIFSNMEGKDCFAPATETQFLLRISEYARAVIEKYYADLNKEKTLQERLKSAFKVSVAEAHRLKLRGQVLRNFVLKDISKDFPSKTMKDLREFLFLQFGGEYWNFQKREVRYRLKANLNRWSYFATFTYDSNKMSEDVFRRRLLRCLSNMSERHGWRYMGVWERGEKDLRLHFHCVLYVPNGEMIGKITRKRGYSFRKHNMQIRDENDFFASTFGINDFEKIPNNVESKANIVRYISKYMRKSGERVVYSRHIPCAFEKSIRKDEIVCQWRNLENKFVVSSSAIDYDRDIARLRLGAQISMFDDVFDNVS